MKKSLLLLATAFMLIGCASTSDPTTVPITDPSVSDPTTSVEEPTTQPTEPSSEPTTAPVVWVDLQTAIRNTENAYSLFGVGTTSSQRALVESFTQGYYCYGLARQGFVVLEEDPKFTHAFAYKTIVNENDEYENQVEMYGRIADNKYVNNFRDRNFFSYITDFISEFTQVEDNVFNLKSQKFAYAIKDFFQSNIVKYCNEFEFTTTPEGRLDYLFCYESNATEKYMTSKYKFETLKSYEDAEEMKIWREAGSKINVRIADYKNLYKPSTFADACSVYNGEKVEFEAIVTTSDVDNNLYVSYLDDRYGYVGIRIPGKGNLYQPKDMVKVSGTIATQNFVAYVKDPVVTDLGTKSNYLPVYNEEAGGNIYGTGFYTTGLFVQNPPLFSDSLYNTGAYIGKFDAKTYTADAKIELVFDKQLDQKNNPLRIDLVIPQELSSDKKDEIYSVIESVGLYGSVVQYQLDFTQILTRFDSSKEYFLSYEATEDTIVRLSQTPKQRIESTFGFENFPMLEAESSLGFAFGAYDTVYIESYFGKDTSNPVQGAFTEYTTVKTEDFNAYIETLYEYGFELVDIVRDLSRRVHHILKYGDNIYASLILIEAGYYNETAKVEFWIYYADEPVIPDPIEKRLEAAVGDFFNIDTFERLAGTFDKDYEIFELPTYAGVSFKDDPLVLYTINVEDRSAQQTYAKQLIQNQGYKQYRVGTTPYQYTTRGVTHTVLVNPEGTFVDIATYSTTDYTFAGHDEFTYRMEVMVYNSKEPIKIKSYDDLSVLTTIYAKQRADLDYNHLVTLPEGTKVEYWAHFDKAPVTYGYGCRDEVFIYCPEKSQLREVYEQIKDALVEIGMKAGWTNGSTKASFSITDDGQYFFTSMMLCEDKGYLRLMNDILGVSFTDN